MDGYAPHVDFNITAVDSYLNEYTFIGVKNSKITYKVRKGYQLILISYYTLRCLANLLTILSLGDKITLKDYFHTSKNKNQTNVFYFFYITITFGPCFYSIYRFEGNHHSKSTSLNLGLDLYDNT